MRGEGSTDGLGRRTGGGLSIADVPAPPVSKRPTPPDESHRLPEGFRIVRNAGVGRYPLLTIFPGIQELDSARRLEPDAHARTKLFGETKVEVVAEDMWMYVAPWDKSKPNRGWDPVVTAGTDCIVVGQSHLVESPALILFLDIFHELCHVRQRHDGRELWDRRWSYVERPTEVEAYRFVVEEGRRLGVSEEALRDYLEVEWISAAELQQLWKAVSTPSK
jgi:hypothetical protein